MEDLSKYQMSLFFELLHGLPLPSQIQFKDFALVGVLNFFVIPDHGPEPSNPVVEVHGQGHLR